MLKNSMELMEWGKNISSSTFKTIKVITEMCRELYLKCMVDFGCANLIKDG
jgi:hypothetical protein